MRDNFYHWLAVALAFALFTGATAAHFAHGDNDFYGLVMGGFICALSTAGAIRSFRRAKAGEDA